MTSLLLSFSTLVLALLSSWHAGSLPWEAVLVAALAVAVDRGIAAFRVFSQEREPGRRRGYSLLAGVGLYAFSAVLILFLSLGQGWPLLLLCGTGALAPLVFGRAGVPKAPWGEVLVGIVPGVLLWMATAFVLDPQQRWSLDFWWRTAVLSLPSALFLASLATVRRSCERERSGHGVLLLPLAAYVVIGVLATLKLLPWTFFLALLIGPALSAPLWRSMFRGGFSLNGRALPSAVSALLVYTLVSAAAWVGNALS